MIVFLALLEILCLVFNCLVEKTIRKPRKSGKEVIEDEKPSFIFHLIQTRYKGVNVFDLGKLIWCLIGFGLFMLSWLLFGISFAFDPDVYKVNSSFYDLFAWKLITALVLTLNIIFVVHSHILSSRKRPKHLDVNALNVLFLINMTLFIYGVILLGKWEVIWNVPFVILIALQFFDFMIMALIYLILAVTYWLGREGHGGESDRESMDIRIETSESNPFSIDFIDFSVAMGMHTCSNVRQDARMLEIKARGGTSSYNSGEGNSSGEFISDVREIRIGMSVLPGRCRGSVRRNVDKDLDRVKNHFSIDTIVSLMPEEQLAEMKVSNLIKAVEDHGMVSIMHGWRDKWIPDYSSLDFTIALVHKAISRIRRGDSVLIHCMGGKGRTGLLAVCILINLGYTLPESIAIIRRSRRGCIHNPLQLYYLSWYCNYYNQINYYKSNNIEIPLDYKDELDQPIALTV